MKTILKYLGGSFSYGLQGPSSDEDIRGIFLHTDPKYILGLNRWDHQENKAGGADEIYFEFRHFCNLLKNGNSQAYEALFLDPESILEKDKEYDLLVENREAFLDSDKLFKCLMGYIQSERKLAIGERTGKLGGKRIEQLEKYGFSPKNIVQLFRLSWAGTYFFNHGIFPVKISCYDSLLSGSLYEIKTKPEEQNKEELLALSLEFEEALKNSFDNRKISYKFNEDRVNQLILEVYKPHLI